MPPQFPFVANLRAASEVNPRSNGVDDREQFRDITNTTVGKRILVVDDSQSIRQHVRTTLAEGGFEVVEAVDGLDALETLKARTDIDVVICDVNMPRLDGLGLLDELKAAGAMARLQVLMLTTEGQPAMMQRAKQAGAKGWIVKPFKPPLLLAAIKKIAGQ